MIPAAITVALGSTPFAQPANAQYYRRTAIVDGRNGDVALVRHEIDCNCGPLVRTCRAGTFSYVVPRPPRYSFPRGVVPAYPVTSPRQQQALLPVRPWYPSGTDSRVITLDEMPPAAPQLRRPSLVVTA